MTSPAKLAEWEAFERDEHIGHCIECREPCDEPMCELCCRWEVLDEEAARVS